MKLKSLFVFLMVCLMVSGVWAADWSAGFYWDSNTANWTADPVGAKATYWVNGNDTVEPLHGDAGLPDGSLECIIGRNLHTGIVSGGEVTIDSYIEWGAAGYATSTTGNRMRVAGNSTLNITPDAEFIGAGFIRVGEKSMPNKVSTAYAPSNFTDGVTTINQTGGLFGLLAGGRDTTKLMISDGGSTASIDSDGLYVMSGGTLTSYGEGEGGTIPNDDIGHIIIGDRNGAGKFQIIGTAPSITMGGLYVGAGVSTLLSTAYRAAEGTLQFDVKAAGVSPIVLVAKTVQSDGATWDPGVIQPIVAIDGAGAAGTATLTVNLLEALTNPTANILLVDNTGTRPVWGTFDTVNGAIGAQGAIVMLGGKYYTLTYYYDAHGDGFNNDIALIPEPATLALLGLGMFIIRRKK